MSALEPITFAAVRLTDIITASLSKKIWKNYNVHKRVPQDANGRAALVQSFDGTAENSSNSMVAYGRARGGGYMVCVTEKPVGHHPKR